MASMRSETVVVVLPRAKKLGHAAPTKRQDLRVQEFVLHGSEDAFYDGNRAVATESAVPMANVMVVAPGQQPRPKLTPPVCDEVLGLAGNPGGEPKSLKNLGFRGILQEYGGCAQQLWRSDRAQAIRAR